MRSQKTEKPREGSSDGGARRAAARTRKASGDGAPGDETPKEQLSELPPRAASPRSSGHGRPWWVYGVLALVLSFVVYTHLRDDDGPGDELSPVTVDPAAPRAERLRVRVVNRYPHQADAFTQGLLFHDGYLYESTGQRRRSTLRRVDLETGEVLLRRAMEDHIFAEGLARVGDELIQLSWTAGEANVYRLSDFEHVRTFRYEGEGWGLCYDGEHLVMSDGSDRLAFRDPETFEVVRTVRVSLDGRPLGQLNELECVDGAVWANVWRRDDLVRIDPDDGTVTAVADASGLLSANEAWVADVLNGIAWVPSRNRFVITGKYWPYLFEVELVPTGSEGAD